MRPLDPAFATHIQSGATTLCTCWRIARADGTVHGFTDHDRPLTFDGTTYASTVGADGSEITAKAGAATDSADLVGLISSPDLTETDLRQGRFDGAEVTTYRVNWRDPAVRDRVRIDTIGEISQEDGLFRAELRSPRQALNVHKGRLYQALCGTTLGTAQCGIDLDDSVHKGTAILLSAMDRNRISVSGLAGFGAGIFAFGSASWQDGGRAGLKSRVTAHTKEAGTDILCFADDVSEGAAPGDVLVLTAGCDRRFATCRDRFANSVNFRGFPHIPGNDYVLSYPKDGEDLDGKALFE